MEKKVKSKRAGLFLLIAGLVWFALSVVLVHAPWAMSFRKSMNFTLMFYGPEEMEWYNYARFILFEALFFGYKSALLLVLAGIGVLLL